MMNYRQTETREILSFLAEDSLPSSILVLGPSSSGKFSTVEHCLKQTHHQWIVINSLGCYSSRSLFESILLNLSVADDVKSLVDIASSTACKSGAQFVRQLRTLAEKNKLTSLCIVFRNSEKLLDVLDSPTLSLITRPREHTKLNICSIFISAAPVQKFFGRPDFQSNVITFRPYTPEQMVAITKSSLVCPSGLPQATFDWFVEFLFRSVQSITHDLVEIRYLMTACLPRFHKMFLDLTDTQNQNARNAENIIGSPKRHQPMNQTMAIAQLHKQLAVIVDLICQHGVYTRNLNEFVECKENECSQGLLGFLQGTGTGHNLLPAEVALSHLSAQAKLLLISAFVAAKNAPSSDRLLFENKTSKAENRMLAKHRRKHERAKTSNVNPLPQPPRMFRLRRLVSIYQYFASQASVIEQMQEKEEDGDVSDVITSDVMNAITSLVDLRLLSAAKSKDSLANPAYYCSLPYDDVSRLAKSVNIKNLEAYLDDFGGGGGAAFDDG